MDISYVCSANNLITRAYSLVKCEHPSTHLRLLHRDFINTLFHKLLYFQPMELSFSAQGLNSFPLYGGCPPSLTWSPVLGPTSEAGLITLQPLLQGGNEHPFTWACAHIFKNLFLRLNSKKLIFFNKKRTQITLNLKHV